MHGLPPRAQEPRSVGHRESTGRSQRGVFSKRMTGDELRLASKIEPCLNLQHAHGRK